MMPSRLRHGHLGGTYSACHTRILGSRPDGGDVEHGGHHMEGL